MNESQDLQIRPQETYTQLAREFEHTFHDERGGFSFDYITGEQATSRLNEVLGHDGWSFQILKSEVIEDEVLVLGELTVKTRDRSDDPEGSIRQQYGSQKIKRSRGDGKILDIGFDHKGAATDALKKCASMIGVGLYLSRKEERPSDRPAYLPSTQIQRAVERQWDADGNDVDGITYTCETCGEELRDSKRKDGTVWKAAEKVAYSQKQYQGRTLCYNCSRNAG